MLIPKKVTVTMQPENPQADQPQAPVAPTVGSQPPPQPNQPAPANIGVISEGNAMGQVPTQNPVTPIAPAPPQFLSSSQMRPVKEKHHRPLLWLALLISIVSFLSCGAIQVATNVAIIWLPVTLSIIALIFVIIGKKIHGGRVWPHLLLVIPVLLVTSFVAFTFGVLTKPFGSGLATIGGPRPFSIEVAEDFAGRQIPSKSSAILGTSIPLTSSASIDSAQANVLVIINVPLKDNFTPAAVRTANNILAQQISPGSGEILVNNETLPNGELLFAFLSEEGDARSLGGTLTDFNNKRAYTFVLVLRSGGDAEIEQALEMIRSIKPL